MLLSLVAGLLFVILCGLATTSSETSSTKRVNLVCSSSKGGSGLSQLSSGHRDSAVVAVLDQLVNSHRAGVDTLVEWKTTEWHYYAGHRSYPEAPMNACPRTSPKIRKFPKQLPKATLESFDWDDEQDISHYFSRLQNGCSKNASTRDFKKDCLDFIGQLVYEPKCTTRFDSRVKCQRGNAVKPSLSGSIDSIHHMLEKHFADDTVNVLIVGGGPVGLFLANALAMFSSEGLSSLRPRIRVAVIENRAEAEGVKHLYSRNWQTELETEAFGKGAVVPLFDQRIVDIVDVISNGKEFYLPVNALETLFMMSNRDKGVKFVYGNLNDYTELLSHRPNLVAFDATGHRLTGLVRGNDCPRPQPTPGIVQTVAEAEEVNYTPIPDLKKASVSDATAYKYFKEYNHLVQGRQKGEILYPVAKDGTPLSTWWLHVNSCDLGQQHHSEDGRGAKKKVEEGDNAVVAIAKTDMCVACQTKNSQISKDMPDLCMKSCYFNDMESAIPFFRKDIGEYLETSAGDTKWIGLTFATIKLSGKQAQWLQNFIAQSEYANNPLGMPLDRVPLEEVSSSVQHNLAIVRDHGGSKPFISVFQHRPYVYWNGEMQGDLFGAKTRILRIGDSLMVGDFNNGTGLTSHLKMMWVLLCGMRNLEVGDGGYGCKTEPTAASKTVK